MYKIGISYKTFANKAAFPSVSSKKRLNWWNWSSG